MRPGARGIPPCHSSHAVRAVVRLLATFMYDGHYCLVAEALGPDLLSTLRDPCCKAEQHSDAWRGFVSRAALVSLAAHCLGVLCLMHKCRLVHADIKLENILLKERCARGVPCRSAIRVCVCAC